MHKKPISLLILLVVILSTIVALGASFTVADIPEGFVPYARDNSGAYPIRGDIVWVKAGLDLKIPGFLPADQIPAIVNAAGGDIDGYLKHLVDGGAADPGLKSLTDRKTGRIIGYDWGAFSYNCSLNRIIPPGGGSGGNDSSGSGGGDSSGGDI